MVISFFRKLLEILAPCPIEECREKREIRTEKREVSSVANQPLNRKVGAYR
jgi:hypothetical protein